jgi:arylsulfatase A-like enzyme
VPGVFFSNYKIKTQTPSIMDIAPTVLSLFGVPVPGHMDGQPLVEAGQTQRAAAAGAGKAPGAGPEKMKKTST